MGRGRNKRAASVEEDPVAQNGDPPHGENSQGHQTKRKRDLEVALQAAGAELDVTTRKLEETTGDLDQARQELMEAEDEIDELKHRNGEQEAEIERLRAQLANQVPPNGEDDAGHHNINAPPAPPPQATELQAASKMEKDAVRAAGRRCCVLHIPWMQGDSLFDTEVRNNFESILTGLEAIRRTRNEAGSDSEPDEEDPVDEFWRTPHFDPASPVDMAREVMSHMSLPLAKKWFEPWFKGEFRYGMRKMRSEAVSEIADHRHIVFNLPDDLFGQRNDGRKRGAGAKALLDDDAFMWQVEDPDNPKSSFERFMRSDVLLNATKLLLTGPSSVKSEHRSAQAKPARIEHWHVKTITPSILSFIATAVRFVLSGDSVFDKVTPTANYMEIYAANLRLLKKQRARQRRHYDGMTELYNKALLPDLYATNEQEDDELAGMSRAAKEFYLSMNEPSGGEGEGNE